MMNGKRVLTIAIALTLFSGVVFAESVYVDATKNCLGPNGGTYKRVRVQKGITYEITIEENDAVYNTKNGARIVNLGVMYVQSPRKMTILAIEPGKKTYIKTEGNLYFFFIDDARLNSGGARVSIRKAKQKAKKTGLRTNTSKQKSAGCIYRGKPRTAKWVETRYKYFRDKIAFVDGKAYDVGRAICDANARLSGKSGLGSLSSMRAEMPSIGSYFRSPYGGKVLSVISDSECIVTAGSLLFHVKKTEKSLVDNARFDAQRLVCVGKYRYVSNGGIRTVPSYESYSPITKEQFVDAINQGFLLVSYRAVIAKRRGGGRSQKEPLWKIISR